jgi:signal transduction histidine kinase
MKEYPLESGLLSTFRLYIAVRLFFVLIAAGFYIVWYEPQIKLALLGYVAPFVVDIFILFILLYSTWFRRRLGVFFLPLALLISIGGPVIQVGYVLPMMGVHGTFGFLLGFSLLMVPFLLTAWQYSFRWVLLFAFSTALFEFMLLSSSTELNITELRWSTVALVGRSLLSMFISYVVSNLIHEQRHQRQELAQANRKLVRYASTLEQLAISQERNRLARELHDTLAHALSGLAVQLDAIAAVWDPMPPRARLMLERALSITRIGLDETRRALQALRATPLEDLGLGLAIRSLATSVTERAGLELTLDVPEQVSGVSPEVEQAFYRVAQEALENIVQHADANQVSVSLSKRDDRLTLDISDNGLGFEGWRKPTSGRFGIRGMLERADLIGGALEVESHPGQGTTIHLRYNGGRHDSRVDL